MTLVTGNNGNFAGDDARHHRPSGGRIDVGAREPGDQTHDDLEADVGRDDAEGDVRLNGGFGKVVERQRGREGEQHNLRDRSLLDF